MALWKKFPKQQPWHEVQARTLRMLAEQADWTSQLRANPPLAAITTAGGMFFRYPGMLFEAQIAITATAITPRSGDTPGSGRITIQTWNGTALADLPGGSTFAAYNISAAAAGIAVGKYCIVLKIHSTYWIITAEC